MGAEEKYIRHGTSEGINVRNHKELLLQTANHIKILTHLVSEGFYVSGFSSVADDKF